MLISISISTSRTAKGKTFFLSRDTRKKKIVVSTVFIQWSSVFFCFLLVLQNKQWTFMRFSREKKKLRFNAFKLYKILYSTEISVYDMPPNASVRNKSEY